MLTKVQESFPQGRQIRRALDLERWKSSEDLLKSPAFSPDQVTLVISRTSPQEISMRSQTGLLEV